MFELKGDWKKIIKEAFEEIGIINKTTKDTIFTVTLGVKYNGINRCEFNIEIK